MFTELRPKALLFAAGVSLLMAGTVAAYPSRGGHCAYCHSNAGGNVDVEGYNVMEGLMKTFEVAPGGSTQFTLDVTAKEEGRYGLILDGLDTLNPGIYSPRLYTPDPDWSTASGRNPDEKYLFWHGQYFAISLTEDLQTYTFDLTVDPGATPGDYTLTATLAGGYPSAGMGWFETENFVLRVIPEPNTFVLVVFAAAVAGLSLLHKARLRA